MARAWVEQLACDRIGNRGVDSARTARDVGAGSARDACDARTGTVRDARDAGTGTDRDATVCIARCKVEGPHCVGRLSCTRLGLLGVRKRDF